MPSISKLIADLEDCRESRRFYVALSCWMTQPRPRYAAEDAHLCGYSGRGLTVWLVGNWLDSPVTSGGRLRHLIKSGAIARLGDDEDPDRKFCTCGASPLSAEAPAGYLLCQACDGFVANVYGVVQ